MHAAHVADHQTLRIGADRPVRKTEFPGFVETPGRRRSQRRKSIVSDDEDPFKSIAHDNITVKTEPTEDGHMNGHSDLNGHTNGNANGYANGHSNGYVNGHTKEANPDDFKAEAEKSFSKWDTTGEVDFGGAWGMSAMMIGFPALMYYMWIGTTFYHGKIPKPTEGQSWQSWLEYMWFLVKTEAYPNNKAWRSTLR